MVNLKKSAKMHKLIAMLSFFALILLSAAVLGITVMGNEISKEQTQADTGRLTVKGTDIPVQIAITNDHLTSHALSSRVPDKYLAKLDYFLFDNLADNTTTHVKVLAFVRVPQFGALCGSVVLRIVTR